MSVLFIGLATAALLGTSADAASNSVSASGGVAISSINTNDPVEREFRKVMVDDDDAEKEILGWMDSAENFDKSGGKSSPVTLNLRIQQKLDGIKREYQDFVDRHPEHVNAHLAFGSFLNDNNDDIGALLQWEKARDLAPTNPAPWNDLGNYYAQPGRQVQKAFEAYGRAIDLNSNQPVYYHNLAAAIYLFRSEAAEYYHIDATQAFEKALTLYQSAIKLDPRNFILATDYAEAFYGINPPRLQEGLAAWENALKLAPAETEREGVFLHLSRIHLQLGQLEQARSNLNLVTNANYAELKANLSNKLAKAQQLEKKTQ